MAPIKKDPGTPYPPHRPVGAPPVPGNPPEPVNADEPRIPNLEHKEDK